LDKKPSGMGGFSSCRGTENRRGRNRRGGRECAINKKSGTGERIDKHGLGEDDGAHGRGHDGAALWSISGALNLQAKPCPPCAGARVGRISDRGKERRSGWVKFPLLWCLLFPSLSPSPSLSTPPLERNDTCVSVIMYSIDARWSCAANRSTRAISDVLIRPRELRYTQMKPHAK